MSAGYDAKQIQGVVDAANAINEHFQTLKLPKNFKVGESISVPLLIGEHQIATVTVFTTTMQGNTLDPHISFTALNNNKQC